MTTINELIKKYEELLKESKINSKTPYVQEGLNARYREKARCYKEILQDLNKLKEKIQNRIDNRIVLMADNDWDVEVIEALQDILGE